MKVLLTGGNGFIATQCLKRLLAHGHEVVTTVRSTEKGEHIVSLYPGKPVSYSIVKDIAQPGAFDDVVKDSGIEAVVHTASPFHYQVEDNKRDMLDPTIEGTTGILKAVKTHAPKVRRVVITSSFAAMTNPKSHPKVYNEDCWNPMTMEEALETTDPQVAYRGSKKFAEQAAWEFVEKEKPNFDLVTLNPPFVFGPADQQLKSLDDLNTSNQRILNIVRGKKHEGPSGSSIWVDVRDLAEAHALAVDVPAAGGKRFFITAGYASDYDMGEIIKESFPALASRITPELGLKSGGPAYDVDNTRSTTVLGLKYRSLRDCIVDTVQSLLDNGA